MFVIYWFSSPGVSNLFEMPVPYFRALIFELGNLFLEL